MTERKVKLNVEFDLVFDSGELSVYLDGSDVTDSIKEQIGQDEFRDLAAPFLPAPPTDPMDLAKEHDLEAQAV